MIRQLISLILLFCVSGLLYSQEDSEIRLIKFEPSECQDEFHVYQLNNRIVSFEKHGDTTVIEISVKANCCISLKPDIKLYSDTIDLIYDYSETEYVVEKGDTFMIFQEECDCECCFSFKYHLLGLENKSYVYLAGNSIIDFSQHMYIVIQEPKFRIDGSDTTNYVDIYGMRQGLHKFYDVQNREIRSLIYLDDLPESGLMRRVFSETGKIEKEFYQISDGEFKVILFDLEGNAIKECITSDYFDIDETKCMELD
ncbi:MAG: hypothetical protein GQ564_16345 [Bacteroidales bacterium]|nr:hypothetical protein [Bacteroidales bacterium]